MGYEGNDDSVRAIPFGWSESTLDGIADHCLGKMLDEGKQRPGVRMPYLRNINVRWGAFDLADLLEMPFEAHEHPRYGVEDGDLIICEGGEPGRCAVWRGGDTELKIQKALHRVRFRDGHVPEFFAYQLRWLVDQQLLSKFFTGTTIKHLPGVALKRIPFRYPEPSVQRRIVARIDELFGEIEAGERELAAAKVDLGRYRRAVLKAAVTGELTCDWREQNQPNDTGADLLARILEERRARWENAERAKFAAKGQTPKNDGWKSRYPEPVVPTTDDLPELPEGWTWASIDQLTVRVTKGSSPNWQGFEYQDHGVLFVRSQNIGWGELLLDDRAYLAAGFNEKEPRSVLAEGDVLLNIVGASIGRAAVATAELSGANTNQAVAGIRPVRPDPLSDLICIALIAPPVQVLIHSQKVDVARANLSLEQIRALPIALPNEAEVRALSSAVSATVECGGELSEAIEVAAQDMARVRQAILSSAFNGKLVGATDRVQASVRDIV